MVYGSTASARWRLLDGCQCGQLVWQPCYPCAIVVWSADMLPMRMCRRRPDGADRLAGASKKPASLRRFACRTRFWLFKCARSSRARGVPKSRGRRVAAGAAFVEMRRINDISRLAARAHPPFIGTRARRRRGGSLSSGARSFLRPSVACSHVVGPRRASKSSLAALAGCWHPAPRARRAGLHSEENPAAAIQNHLLRVTSLHVHTGT